MHHESECSRAARPFLRIGTSGWVYKHWMGRFYPAGMRGNCQLPFYAGHFTAVEINFSFYRLPERSVFEAWRQQTPDDFLFAVKASRYLTHMKKLKDPAEPLQRLLSRADGLGAKLGPILFQFPRNWPVHIERLAPFLEALGQYPRHQWTFEFRHPSWLSEPVYRLLKIAGAALCLPVHPSMPIDVRLTAPWTYIRMHGGERGIGYEDRELDLWADRIRGFMNQGCSVHVYFNNDAEGHALADASRLREMMTD